MVSNLHNMEDSKVMFSPSELSLMQNSELFLTKNGIIRNIYGLFGQISSLLTSTVEQTGPDWVKNLSASPKISKGEQYEEMPWVMLDYPRIFSKDRGIFALRTFFWWGNYFAVQWVVSGIFIEKGILKEKMERFPENLEGIPLYWGIVADPWDNRIPQEGLTKVGVQGLQKPVMEGKTVKIAIKVSLDDWKKMPQLCLGMQQLLIR